MNSTGLEATVEARLVKAVIANNGECLKITGYAGWCDRLVLWPGGITHFVELKRPKGSRFEPLQQRRHAKLRAMGFDVFVIYTREQVDAYVKEHGCG